MRNSVLFSALLLMGCGESSPTASSTSDPAPEAAAVTHVHDLACGCALEEVGKCGNYINIDGHFVELVGDTGLGVMAFCKQDGLKGEVAGEMKEGKFVATSFEYADL
ncbi:MAG: hypothetical protein V2A76_07815 [Planctomycetota bacterium]